MIEMVALTADDLLMVYLHHADPVVREEYGRGYCDGLVARQAAWRRARERLGARGTP